MAEKKTTSRKTTTKAAESEIQNGAAAPTQVSALGIPQSAHDGIVALLGVLLADEYVLYTKLRKFHWNVRGATFFQLHEAFEAQYTALEEVIDSLAERIRQFGAFSPGTLAEFVQLARLQEQPGVNPDAHGMVTAAADDHEQMVRVLRDAIELIDDDLEDEVGVIDLLTGYLQLHQKYAWMLRATATVA